ncbi:hypothetical protein NESM_000822100 [Novymonas esmeraldas]|uniref:Uncharacterized protein n=1 Tax=Novymonas esmeraldas TaxID=1808958 RepID=A0AAW0EYK7_9TRYP
MFHVAGSALRRRGLSVALIVTVALVSLLGASALHATAAEEGPRMSPVAQCSEDFRLMCPDATSTRNLWGCMMKNSAMIRNDMCKEYVVGFRACTSDAEKRGTCVYPAADYATSVRRCLRTIPEENISEPCRSSRFYAPIAELLAAQRATKGWV